MIIVIIIIMIIIIIITIKIIIIIILIMIRTIITYYFMELFSRSSCGRIRSPSIKHSPPE